MSKEIVCECALDSTESEETAMVGSFNIMLTTCVQ
jgi:hypothetical protein